MESRRRRSDPEGFYKKRVEESETLENVLGMAPGIGTGMTVSDIKEELGKDDPSYGKVGMMVAGEAVGLVPGLGQAGKTIIRKVTSELYDKTEDAKKALAMIENQELRDAWVKNKRKELGISDSDKDYAARDLVSKQEVKRRQTRKFKEQVEALESGEMSGPEYRRYIRKNQPATKFTKEDVQTMFTSYEDMVGGLDAQGQNKAAKGIIGLTDNLEKGAEVAARLDIPAYNKRDIWVAQITGAGKNMYGRTAVLKNVKFFIEGKDPARKVENIMNVAKNTPGPKGEKKPFATMKGEWQDLSDEEAFEKALTLMDDPEWIQVGFNPERHSFFYDKDTMMPVFEAEEVIQVGPLVLAKKAKLGDKRIDPETGKASSFVPAERIRKIRELKIKGRPGNPTVFNEGGLAMEEQMTMAFMDEGGIIDDDMDVDPVSGNEVPPGSLAEEVRDDIPAQLSEGEYVVPADVVRYYGVKFFEDLRERAKIGLAEMEANGRIGGEPVPDGGPKMGDSPLSPEEQAAVNSILGMAEGGTVQNPYLQQQQMYTQPAPQAVGNTKGFSGGGLQPPTEEDDDLPTMTEAELTTPTVYNDANYSFLSDSPKIEEAFTPVLMIYPDTMAEQLATTKKMYDQLIEQGYIPKKDYDAGQADTTTTPTTGGSGGSGGGSGGSTTVTPKGGGFKNWGDDIDWSDPESITQFVNDSQEGMIDPKTGKKLAQAGLALGGPGLGAVGGAVGSVSQMGAISDMRAAAIIARAQGNDSLAATIEGKVEQVLKNSSGLTRLVDKFFKGMMDGDAKAKAKMDKLGLKYDPDNITEYSSEQIAANQLALKQEYETKSGVNKKKAIKSFDSKKYQKDQDKKKSKASDMLKNIEKNKNKFLKPKQTGNPVTDAASSLPSNKAQTEKNLKDVTNKLKNAQQTGNFSLNKGGLMTKGKKKK